MQDPSLTFPVLAGPVVELSPRRVRVRFGEAFVADSTHALLLRQYGPNRLPTYYFPPSDVRMEMLAHATPDPESGDTYWTVRAADHMAENAAWMHHAASGALADLTGYLTFAWSQMTGWYEEEEEIFVHARDPYKRVDVLPSARHVRVVIASTGGSGTQYRLFVGFCAW